MTTGKKVLVWCAAAVSALVIASGAIVLYLCWDEPPPDDSDLQVPLLEIPDEENGLTYFTEAARQAWEPRDGYSEVCAKTGEPQTQQEWYEAMLYGDSGWDDKVADGVLARNAGIFELVEKGLACSQCRFRPWASEGNLWETYLGGERLLGILSVARIYSLRTRYLAKGGQAEQAMAETKALVEFGCRIQNAHGSLVHVLVGTMAKEMGLEQLRKCIPRATLAPEQMRALAEELARYHVDGEAFADSLRLDYQITAKMLEEANRSGLRVHRTGWGSPVHDPPAALYLKVNETKRMYADIIRVQIENLDKPFAHRKPTVLPEDPGKRGTFWMYATPNSLGKAFLSNTDTAAAIENVCKDRADVSATRLLLALRAFATAEERLPEGLDELVPDFLDAVPPDPFDGKPMRYNPEKKVIYTVGEDLTDSGGTTEAEWLDEMRLECEAKGGEWTAEDERIAKESGEMNRWKFPDPSWAIEF